MKWLLGRTETYAFMNRPSRTKVEVKNKTLHRQHLDDVFYSLRYYRTNLKIIFYISISDIDIINKTKNIYFEINSHSLFWVHQILSVYIRIIIFMDIVLENYQKIQALIHNGSIMVPKSKFPLTTFLLGFLFNKITSLQKLFSVLQSLCFLVSEKKLNPLFEQQLLVMLYQKPYKISEISNLLQKLINNEEVQVFSEIQKMESQSTSSNFNKEDYSKAYEGKNEMKKEPVDVKAGLRDNKEEQIIYDEKYFAQQERMLKQSEQLAKKLQQQEQKQVKKNVADDAVCQICYVGLYEQDFLPLQNCEHIFHKACLSQSFKYQISQNKFPLKCANDQCQMQVKDNDIKQILQSEVYSKYQKHTLKFYADMNGDTTSWCPTADCQYMFFFEKQDQNRFQCPECSKQYCLNCRVEWHKDMTCKEYQVTNTTTDDDLKFMNFVKGKKFKQCPRCKFWVQKNHGCDHMTCKCKFQFCYKCGGVYGKCQCVEKAQEQMRRRMEMAAERNKKKADKKKAASVKKSERPKRKR